MKKSIKDVVMIGNNILVKVELPSIETESGLVVSEDTARETQKTISGLVMSVGPEVKDFKVGEDILLPPHGSTPVIIEREVFHVFRETSLFAKFK
jgi:co-chaperonin GroES (HSP10)